MNSGLGGQYTISDTRLVCVDLVKKHAQVLAPLAPVPLGLPPQLLPQAWNDSCIVSGLVGPFFQNWTKMLGRWLRVKDVQPFTRNEGAKKGCKFACALGIPRFQVWKGDFQLAARWFTLGVCSAMRLIMLPYKYCRGSPSAGAWPPGDQRRLRPPTLKPHGQKRKNDNRKK